MTHPAPMESPSLVKQQLHELENRVAAILELPDKARPQAFEGLRDSHPQHAALLERWEQVAQGLEPELRSAGSVSGKARADALAEAPKRIGAFRILDVLGEGGMGIVYLAEQEKPVRRRVALKLIKAGMDTKDVVARFESERQALALMDHPNIAKVYEGGQTEDGRPYFALEHVPGLPINDFCDRQRLDLRSRIQLFQRVCHGVQHAHQKGIIHRDLKPTNILVQMRDGRVEPKIIDFGVAKALQLRLTERTLYTEHGRILGTPEYMSPEQAEMSGLDIDTRSDVYSLGVLLYQLLAGALPLDGKELRCAGYFEMQRRIREEEPPRPSTRASTMSGKAGEVAARRRLGPRALEHALQGDLDWITLCCLEKDPSRRYASASELALDLRRHLEHEPVVAGPPSTIYRLKKLLRKHRGGVIVAGLVVVTLVVGWLAAVWQHDVATANLASYQRMRDVPQLADLKAEEARLWPAVPATVPAMDAWLARARELAARLEAHRAALEELRLRTREPTEGEERTLERLAKLREERDRRERVVAAARDEGWNDWRLRNLGTPIRMIDRQIAPLERKELLFERTEDAFLYGTLVALIFELEELTHPKTGLIRRVEARRARAASARLRSIDEAADQWKTAIEAIDRADGVTASALYARTPRLTPQLGLVPIGLDPRSGLWEFAVLDTGSTPRRGEGGALQIQDDTALVLVLIPAGRFEVGAVDPTVSTHYPEVHNPENQSPGQEVELDAFFLSKYEMTQTQWKISFGGLQDTPGHLPGAAGQVPNSRSLPVTVTGWHEARMAMRRLGLELPTEAQWEYAACGGQPCAFWWAVQGVLLEEAENTADKYLHRHATWLREDKDLDDGHHTLAPVGCYRPNPFGLHDVQGNLSEWCRDLWAPYAGNPARSGDGLRQPERDVRGVAVRGGAYRRLPIRSQDRWWTDDLTGVWGLRPARKVTP